MRVVCKVAFATTWRRVREPRSAALGEWATGRGSDEPDSRHFAVFASRLVRARERSREPGRERGRTNPCARTRAGLFVAGVRDARIAENMLKAVARF